MARKTANEGKKSTKRKQPGVATRDGRDGTDHSAQDSEYLDLRKRVDARKDAKHVLKIAQRIADEPDS